MDAFDRNTFGLPEPNALPNTDMLIPYKHYNEGISKVWVAGKEETFQLSVVSS